MGVLVHLVVALLLMSSRTIDSFFAPVVKKQRTAEGGAGVVTKGASKASEGDLSPRGKSSSSNTAVPVTAISSGSSGTSNGPETTGDEETTEEMSGPWRQAVLNMEPSWKAALCGEFKKPYFNRLLMFLEGEKKAGKVVYPPVNQMFSAFELCPLDKVKVVCIGQDPYHGPGQAHGLAFSVAKGVAIPPSLKNMIKEAASDENLSPRVKDQPGHGNLESWAKQGVLMLNTCLTVRKREANSHQKRGWEEFTDAVVRALAKKEGVIYLLWGKPASKKCANINTSKNTAIRSSHPSPLGAYKTDAPFMGSKCFSRCNTALSAQGETPIDWNL